MFLSEMFTILGLQGGSKRRRGKRNRLSEQTPALSGRVEQLEERALLSAVFGVQGEQTQSVQFEGQTTTFDHVTFSNLSETSVSTGDAHAASALQTRQSPPILTPIGNRVIWGPDPFPGIDVSAFDPDGTILTFTAQVHNLEWAIDQQFGLFTTGNLHRNWGGLNEIWLQGSAFGEWYFVTPFGQMVLWDGSPRATGELMMNLDPAVNANPALLHSAQHVNPGVGVTVTHTSATSARLNFNISPNFHRNFAVTVQVTDQFGMFHRETFAVFQEPSALRRDLNAGLGLRTTGNLFFNWGGQLENWILGDAGWYFIVPNGDLFLWDRTPNIARGMAVANADAIAWQAPELLFNGQNRFWDAHLDLFFTGNFHFNWGGRQEKWIRGTDGQWYFIEPNGRFTAWDGRPSATGTLIDILSVATYNNPALLFNALEDSPLTPTSLTTTTSTASTGVAAREHDVETIDTVFTGWNEDLPNTQLVQQRPRPTLTRNR